ncbi:MAG: hypothetical protein LAT67_06810 [Balneolales bacterium]|nr:hypothetical protein [Balneolales bacterium]
MKVQRRDKADPGIRYFPFDQNQIRLIDFASLGQFIESPANLSDNAFISHKIEGAGMYSSRYGLFCSHNALMLLKNSYGFADNLVTYIHVWIEFYIDLNKYIGFYP